MIQFFDPATQSFLSGLNRIQARAQRAQRELTTGLRINTVSDAPDQISNLLEVRAQLDSAKQISANLGRVKTETDAAEGALQNGVKIIDNIITLGTQGQPNTITPETRAELGAQVGAALEQLVAVTSTSVEGRYVFSGDNDQQPPYTLDLTQPYPLSPYAGSAATRQVQHADGSLFSVSKTAQEIFDSSNAGDNVFLAVNDLRTALLNNNQAGIDASLASLMNAGRHVNTELSFYGSVQNRVQSATDFASNYQTQLHTEMSGIEDADLAESITELSQASVQQQAALSAQAKLPKTSLFDYLG